MDVTLDRETGDGDEAQVVVKLQTPDWELNIHAAAEAVAELGAIRETNWAARRCLHIGYSAGAPVHWAAEGETATILVGMDDESWDFAVLVPTAIVDQIVADVAARRW
ncbi:hypothetical protein [Flindersiella endophytica]